MTNTHSTTPPTMSAAKKNVHYVVIEYNSERKHYEIVCASTDLSHAKMTALYRATEDMYVCGGTCVQEKEKQPFLERQYACKEGDDILHQYTAKNGTVVSCNRYLVVVRSNSQ
jgi:hypothetical protein